MKRSDASHLLKEAQRCLDCGQLAAARNRFERLCKLDESSAAAWLGLGQTLLAEQQAVAAVSPLEKAAQLSPRSVATLTSLGNCYLQVNRPGAAIEVFTRLIELEPDNQYARVSLGKTYFNIGKPRKAATQLKVAIENEPENIEVYAFLCNALLGCAELVEAAACLEKARRLSPMDAGLLSALAMTYIRLGMIEAAQPVCAELLRLDPGNVEAHSAYLYSFCYLPDISPETRFREHVRWGERHAPAPAAPPVFANERRSDRRLRVGYVSADFFVHSVAYFIESLLAHHDKGAVETFCYANLDKFDSKTNDFRQLADHWREIKPHDDAAVADRIRADRIDILVDLAGHTADNRLGVFVRKPAPVQVSYIGYPATTGMAAMDYRLTDAQADPPGGSEHLHTETLIRLPGGFLCYRPPPAPPVRPPPCLVNGHPTFGSFNKPGEAQLPGNRAMGHPVAAGPRIQTTAQGPDATLCRCRGTSAPAIPGTRYRTGPGGVPQVDRGAARPSRPVRPGGYCTGHLSV